MCVKLTGAFTYVPSLFSPDKVTEYRGENVSNEQKKEKIRANFVSMFTGERGWGEEQQK